MITSYLHGSKYAFKAYKKYRICSVRGEIFGGAGYNIRDEVFVFLPEFSWSVDMRRKAQVIRVVVVSFI